MKKNKNSISFFILISGISISVIYFLYVNYYSFVNSGFFSAIVTFLVGGTAIFLYLKQRLDHKSDSAQLIIQEIRYAEHLIRDAALRDYDYNLADKILPTNSWHKNIHLFVNDLKESELDIISRFYSNAAYLDVLIEKISDEKNKALLINVQQLPGQPQLPVQAPTQNIILQPSAEILKIVSGKIDLIYNTPAVDKLRAISEG